MDNSHKSEVNDGARDDISAADCSLVQHSIHHEVSLSRANSVYSLSRLSLTNQLSQLQSLKLPAITSFFSSIKAVSSAKLASKLLNEFAEQMMHWEREAIDILTGTNAEDDVEWAAAGGKEGLMEIDSVIKRFECLIDMYVAAIDQVQRRNDISDLSAHEIQTIVGLMEQVLEYWKNVKALFQKVIRQVEAAMEWEELWNSVFAEIDLEMKSLNRLIFEMEESRYDTKSVEETYVEENGITIEELESVISKGNDREKAAGEQNIQGLSPVTMIQPHVKSDCAYMWHEDANLLALFARMQPLKASLDFLPMRLSAFRSRGGADFPTACEDLEFKNKMLVSQWKRLESDAEALRKELGEDQWILVFRNAGRQMLRMCDSIMKSVSKLQEILACDRCLYSPSVLNSRIESFEAKREHYGSAIERVLKIVDKGITDRFTINGEILRLQQVMKQKWADVETAMRRMDDQLEKSHSSESHWPRDSMSTVLSAERPVSGSTIDTPNSSPASSVITSSRINSSQIQMIAQSWKSDSTSHLGVSELQEASSAMNQGKSVIDKFSSSNIPPCNRLSSSSPSIITEDFSLLRAKSDGIAPRLQRIEGLSSMVIDKAYKPRWNSSTSITNINLGNNYKPLRAALSPRKETRNLRNSQIPISRCSRATSSPICNKPSDLTTTPKDMTLHRTLLENGNDTAIETCDSIATGLSQDNLATSPSPRQNINIRLRGRVSTSKLSSNYKQQRSPLIEKHRCSSVANSSQSIKDNNSVRPVDFVQSGRHSVMTLRPKTHVSEDFFSPENTVLGCSVSRKPRWR